MGMTPRSPGFDDVPPYSGADRIPHDAEPILRKRRPKRPRRRPQSAIWVTRALGVLGVVAIAYCLFLATTSRIIRGILTDPTVENQFPGVKSMNMLVIGRDYDYSDADQIIKTKARSDMLMVAHLDFDAHTVKLLSIPRDTRARIPGHGVHKINAAHAFGGPMLTEATVTRNYGIPVDHYMAVDFQGFEEAINMLHGVDLAVDKKMDYDDNWGHLHIHLLPGQQHLDGEQAMGFVRFRHADSDVVRTTRQQALVAAIKMKLIDPTVLLAVPNILNTIDKHTESDYTTNQKIAIAKFVRSAPKDKVEMQTLPSIEGGYYVYTDWQEATPLITTWFGVTPPKPGRTPRHGERYAADRQPRRAAQI